MKNRVIPKLSAVLAVALALLYLAWWWADGSSTAPLNVTMLIIATVPLLLLVPGLWQANRFATTLAGLLIPFHFAYAVMELIANPAVRGWVAIQTFLTLLLFAAVLAVLRDVHRDRQ